MLGWGVGMLAAAAVAASVYWWSRPTQLSLVFAVELDGAPLAFDEYRYDNPGGEGTFKINDFRFLVSNLVLEGSGGRYAVPDSYHLARFDNAARTYEIRIAEIPLRQVETVRFSIGVDEKANTSIMSVGDLDPNSRMAWNWEIGYKFILLEGALKTARESIPLAYHVGFSENRRDFVFKASELQTHAGDERLFLNVDVMKLFVGDKRIDLSQMPSVIMNKEDARTVADNYSALIAPVE
ncbi:hypothetical protein Tel_15925 [Candidatus Tenderia electrophaga]|uniref:Copper-binding protein MbnP-like domain-containing protein n=1 Tax=Candidatus Tenderia electrophaga TaxID=1748243 RepID=A0A0S2THA6_9GAMM|nr:hypothetical protein Tel_15925 [Candidatus Tenderia electrophaga]